MVGSSSKLPLTICYSLSSCIWKICCSIPVQCLCHQCRARIDFRQQLLRQCCRQTCMRCPRCYCASFSVKMTGFNFNSHSSLREQVPKAIRLITCEQIDPCSGLALDTYIVLLAMYCSMVNPSGKRAQRAPSLLHVSGGLEPCRSAKCTCYYVHACKHDSRLHPFRIK